MAGKVWKGVGRCLISDAGPSRENQSLSGVSVTDIRGARGGPEGRGSTGHTAGGSADTQFSCRVDALRDRNIACSWLGCLLVDSTSDLALPVRSGCNLAPCCTTERMGVLWGGS